MKKLQKYLFSLLLCCPITLGFGAASDVTIGDLSARLDDLEKKVDGQSPSGESYATVADIEALRQEFKGMIDGIRQERASGGMALAQNIAPPSLIASGSIEQNVKTTDASDNGADIAGLSDEEAVLKLMENKATNKKEAVEKLRDNRTHEAEKNAPTLETGSPVAQYNEALALYKKGEYNKAERAFTSFIKLNPKDKMVHQAYFWQGDCRVHQNKNDAAKRAFVQSYQENKKGARAPDALYNLGLLLAQDKKTPQACTAWRKLQADFPKLPADLKKKLDVSKKKHKC